ncbi:MAG: peptidoglycan-binding protein [Actinomycetota bacterium]|nr:peptidoglycan-binding protein [Actinomycetota bacterium]
MSHPGVAYAVRSTGAAVLAILLAAAPAAASNRHRHHHRPGHQAQASGGVSSGGVSLSGGPTSAIGSGIGTGARLPGGSRHLGDRVLRPGMTGHDVRVLQDYLTIVGFPTTIDGDFGSQTGQAVKAFQLAHQLRPTGIVGIRVEKVLRAAVAAIQAVPPVGKARINSDGTATAPAAAPAIVKTVVAAANRIIDKPYIYGGGHGTWNDAGYDCSGAVSYALHAAGLLAAPMDSTGLESYGSPGRGHWITIYANSGHTWIVVAGKAFDTADFGGPNIPSGSGPRWRSNPTGNLADGGSYVVRHPSGL